MSTWKVTRDPFYSRIYADGGQQALDEAGFFYDSSAQDQPVNDVEWLCTPMTKVFHAGWFNRPAVIVMTGALCPTHTGHIAMMEAAKVAVEAAGYTVIGGYLSPGHDEYVSSKTGSGNIPASTRVALCAEAVSDSKWIDVDPWEALHRSCAVNFTDVVRRLGAYVSRHYRSHVDVFYACGGDNARFALTFQHQGHCVVVDRPGHSAQFQKYRTDARLSNNPNILWTSCDSPASSTQVRNGDTSCVPYRARHLLEKQEFSGGLVLRHEGIEALHHFSSDVSDICDRLEAFYHNFELLAADHFSGNVTVSHLETQRIRARQMFQGKRIISLDPMISGNFNVEMSRRFGMGGYTSYGHIARPGSPPLERQVSSIPIGVDYVAFDDDIVTGGTINALRLEMKRAGRRFTEAISLETSSGGRDEVADIRDFLLGARAGGLVVTLPSGQVARVPYVFPFVDPHVRLSIKPGRAMQFSAHVWTLNRQFFQGTGITVSELPDCVIPAIVESGFTARDQVADVCLHFSKRTHGLCPGN